MCNKNTDKEKTSVKTIIVFDGADSIELKNKLTGIALLLAKKPEEVRVYSSTHTFSELVDIFKINKNAQDVRDEVKWLKERLMEKRAELIELNNKISAKQDDYNSYIKRSNKLFLRYQRRLELYKEWVDMIQVLLWQSGDRRTNPIMIHNQAGEISKPVEKQESVFILRNISLPDDIELVGIFRTEIDAKRYIGLLPTNNVYDIVEERFMDVIGYES